MDYSRTQAKLTAPSKHAPEELCLVTAFIDIGRDRWNKYSRSVDEYIDCFIPYLKFNHDMIVFIDDAHEQKLRNAVAQHETIATLNASSYECTRRLTIVPINSDMLREHIRAYSKLEMEEKIMKSACFQKLVPPHRKECPETHCAKYNLMQHAKIDFVCYAIEHELSNASYFAWTDFGYFKNEGLIPKNLCNELILDINKFIVDKINFQTINVVDERDNDPEYTITYAPEKIGGFFYFGRRDVLVEYQHIYHSVHDEMHRMGLVDDDQHLMLRCCFKRPDLFHLWNLGGWHKIYTTFCS